MEIGPWGDAAGDVPGVVNDAHRRWGNEGPHCAICAGVGFGDVAPHDLTHGVRVNLCHHHRSELFQMQGGGEDFASALKAVWCAAGCYTAQREQALVAHMRRLRNIVKTDRDHPGSYAWPRMREEAERRWAEGQDRIKVMHDLRAQHSGSTAVVPSLRTMRRWHTQARWLEPSPHDEPPTFGERVLAAVSEWNQDGRRSFGATPLPGWPDRDRWGRPDRRR